MITATEQDYHIQPDDHEKHEPCIQRLNKGGFGASRPLFTVTCQN